MSQQRLTAAQFKEQFGSKFGNTVVNKPRMQTSKPQIRMPKKRTPNRTEAEWMRLLQEDNPLAVLYEPWSLNLPSGTRYTPDVVMIESAENGAVTVTCYEVKGSFIHNSRSIHAFKEAAAAFPWMHWVFAQKKKDGWAVEG